MNHASSLLQCVVLFDIDGTLITSPDARPSPGVLAMDASAVATTGLKGLYRRVEFAGRTDRQIAHDLLVASGREPLDEAVARLLLGYVEALEASVGSRPYRVLGSVRDAVVALRDAGAVIGLGTGNVRRGAAAKLRSAGLDDLFDLDFGGYGDDAWAREDVLRIGAERCDPSGTLPVVVIGDTPHDVRAAQAIGARCIGVCTGMFDDEALRACGACVVSDALGASVVEVVRALVLEPRT